MRKWNLVRRDYRNVTGVFLEQIQLVEIYNGIFGGSGMASADEYDEYAEQCMVLATKSSNPADKARLLQMAQAWRELTAKLDAKQPTGKDSA